MREIFNWQPNSWCVIYFQHELVQGFSNAAHFYALWFLTLQFSVVISGVVWHLDPREETAAFIVHMDQTDDLNFSCNGLSYHSSAACCYCGDSSLWLCVFSCFSLWYTKPGPDSSPDLTLTPSKTFRMNWNANSEPDRLHYHRLHCDAASVLWLLRPSS